MVSPDAMAIITLQIKAQLISCRHNSRDKQNETMRSPHNSCWSYASRRAGIAAGLSMAAILGAGCSASSPVFDNQASTDANTSGTAAGPEIGAAADQNNSVQAAPAHTANSTDAGTADNESLATGSISASQTVTCGAVDLEDRLSILELINETRATGRQCGSEWYPATTSLSWNDQLEAAAVVHSQDLATHDIFSHTGTDGSSVSDRATTQGYEWNLVGENIAAGQPSFRVAMQGWIDSPGHCRNLMQADYSDVAVACVTETDSSYGTYWTQVFGNER